MPDFFEEFVISFWCGPPAEFVNRTQYLAIRDAGFTHVMPPCGPTTVESNRRTLDLCAEGGLKAFIGDSRLPTRLSGDDGAARTRLDALITDYRPHPALAGYFLGDEPGAAAFPGLAEVADYVRRKDPAHPVFVNLFPNYADAGQMGVPTYREYLARFLDTVRPFVLSYDHYHMTANGDGGGFFANLNAAREESKKRGIAFWNIVLLTQHFAYRNLTEAELRYEAMQTLAYGGRGLLWFTYWKPDASGMWHHAMIDSDGLREPHYYQARRVNQEVRSLDRVLRFADSQAVFHVGTVPPNSAGPIPNNAPIQFPEAAPANLTIGLFRTPDKATLALVTSADYRNPATVTARIARSRPEPVAQWDTANQSWTAATGGRSPQLRLEPGGAILLRWWVDA